MKNLFGGFYGASDDETKSFWTSPDSVFVFDTNALLLLYRCERETREAFFSQWEKIRDRVWLPYHVCLEYQRNRLTAIKDHVKELRNAGTHIASRVQTAADLNDFDGKYAATIRRYDSLRGKVSELGKELQDTVDRFVQEQIETRINEADFLTNHDSVRDRISALIGERIGKAPTETEITQLQERGEVRFSKLIPPGFEDAKTKKDETFNFNGITYKRKFGDWFIWHEILTFASEKKPRSVIFVSNDNKKDWVFETGGLTRGPHESLKTELAEKGDGTHFLLYSSASFLVAANEHLEGESSSPEAIKELEKFTLTKHLQKENHKHTYSYYKALNHISNKRSDTKPSKIKDNFYIKFLHSYNKDKASQMLLNSLLSSGELSSELTNEILELIDNNAEDFVLKIINNENHQLSLDVNADDSDDTENPQSSDDDAYL